WRDFCLADDLRDAPRVSSPHGKLASAPDAFCTTRPVEFALWSRRTHRGADFHVVGPRPPNHPHRRCPLARIHFLVLLCQEGSQIEPAREWSFGQWMSCSSGAANFPSWGAPR